MNVQVFRGELCHAHKSRYKSRRCAKSNATCLRHCFSFPRAMTHELIRPRFSMIASPARCAALSRPACPDPHNSPRTARVCIWLECSTIPVTGISHRHSQRRRRRGARHATRGGPTPSGGAAARAPWPVYAALRPTRECTRAPSSSATQTGSWVARAAQTEDYIIHVISTKLPRPQARRRLQPGSWSLGRLARR